MALPRALPLDTVTPDAAPASLTAPKPAAAIAVARPRMPPAEAILPYLQQIDEARWYSNFGAVLLGLERRIAERFAPGAQVVTVANATQALTLTLKAMDLKPGGYVVMPSWTFVATAHAVIAAGLKPWFVDVDSKTWMLDPATVIALSPELAREAVAVIPVCAFGAMPDLAAWRSFREFTGLPVLLDAAAAFDALDDARLPAVVSLHATKVLGVGEGGFLVTDDADLAHRVRLQTNFGFHGSRDSQVAATNSKLSEYAGAVGMAALDAWPVDRLRFLRAGQMLRIALMGCPEVRFQEGWGADWTTSVCTVGLPPGSAAQVAQSLRAEGVDTRAWWGGGCHTSTAFLDCRREALPATEALAASTLGLPFFIDMDGDEIARIAAVLDRALGAG
ncbi:DegT/DnrJ/EryC1/StrS family aminotransferase [Phenylobacterium sp.]|uniref:DegT/DnrJ/EryC1/StrS family aminotransferase n=1 Tax=Phenylobacterium sp. TaxID=1871053 RepID=UPI0012163FFF|nr:DegT/DnrJ/EryC1/StrS family aminotransferase [Phenylobacterium sp.]THD64091.1 MAG: DegT/DnrJ/EryC1/StrS aminotransferase [Phenylobacterium sp.]